MSLARTRAVALTGVRGQLVEVEADLGQGLPGLGFTGLADTSVVESRDRIRAAMQNCGVEWPNRKITVALLPADVRKVGSRFDLALAVAVLAASERSPAGAVADVVWIAELGLDGRLRPVRGVLPSVVAAREQRVRRVVVAPAQRRRGRAGARRRRAGGRRPRASSCAGSRRRAAAASADRRASERRRRAGPDLADVAGQPLAKRAIEVAAAGRHHLFLEGAPGAGKTMLAERLPGLLPELDDARGARGQRRALGRRAAARAGRGSCAARRSRRRTTPRRSRRWSAAARTWRSRARSRSPTAASCSSTRRRSSRRARWTRCGSRWRAAGSCCTAAAARSPTRRGSCSCWRRTRARAARGRATASARAGAAALPATAVRAAARPDRRPGPRRPGAARRAARHRPSAGASAARRRARRAARAAARSAGRARRGGATARCPARRCARRRGRCRRRRWRRPRRYLQRGQLSARGFDRVLRLAWTLADLAGPPCPTAATSPRRCSSAPAQDAGRAGMTDPDDDVLLARAYLSRVGEPASVGLWRFVERGRAGAGDARACAASGRRPRCSPRPRRGAARPTRTPTSPPPSGTGCGWSCPSRRLAALRVRVPRAGRAARARRPTRRRLRRSESGEPVPPLALWVRGPADLAVLGRAVGRASSAPGRRPTYGEHVTRRARLRTGRARRRDRLRRGVRHRRGRAPGGPRRARHHRAGVGRRARPALPAGQRRAVRAGRGGRPADLGEPARVRAATPPLPDPQPAHRCVLDGRRGGRGRRPLGRDEHRHACARRSAGRSWRFPARSPRRCRWAATTCCGASKSRRCW